MTLPDPVNLDTLRDDASAEFMASPEAIALVMNIDHKQAWTFVRWVYRTGWADGSQAAIDEAKRITNERKEGK